MNNAQKELEQALKLNPGFPEAMNNLGIVYYQRRDYTSAGWLFLLSDNSKPDPLVRFNLAKTCLQTGAVDKAREWFEKALQLQPDYCQVNQELGMICLQQGKNEESLSYLRKAHACTDSQQQRDKIAEAIQYVQNKIKKQAK
ncbi:MAG: tetratricopeptide repeat protein [Proteobacteria bacterium]|nr:tetratricopeptide repeat protein [Pseudomonadota bacterium]